ncbi:hypothetical protein C8J57DRAFT_693819 [Mycena rebaudengoi]|nr:hypothetical protein C8J57DRAFT_693819 [Mycena rebaudengoi]
MKHKAAVPYKRRANLSLLSSLLTRATNHLPSSLHPHSSSQQWTLSPPLLPRLRILSSPPSMTTAVPAPAAVASSARRTPRSPPSMRTTAAGPAAAALLLESPSPVYQHVSTHSIFRLGQGNIGIRIYAPLGCVQLFIHFDFIATLVPTFLLL